MLAALLAAALAWAAPAFAQTEVLPGYPDRAARGADKAKGVVIWNHGLSLVAETPSDPPFFVDFLQDAGWDVYRLQRRWAGDNFTNSTAALVDLIARLRAEGYKRVVLAGQSFGAWISIAAAARNDTPVETVIAAAPARFGDSNTSENWRLNGERLYALARDLRRPRLMTFFFDKDSYDPGGRGPPLAAVLKTRNIANVIIDRPEGFEGHNAAGSHVFAKAFGPCIVAFVEIATVPDGFSCKDYPQGPPELGFKLPANLKLNPAPPNAAAGLAGYGGRWYGWSPTGREVMLVVHQLGVDRALAVYGWTAATRNPTDRPGATSRRGEYDPAAKTLRFTEPKQIKIETTLRPDGQLDVNLSAVEGTGPPLNVVMRKLD